MLTFRKTCRRLKISLTLLGDPQWAAPRALGRGMVKAAWFRAYAANELPALFDRVVQSWDTANKATELSDFSVCTSWGIAGKDLYLLHVLRKRMEYPIKCWG